MEAIRPLAAASIEQAASARRTRGFIARHGTLVECATGLLLTLLLALGGVAIKLNLSTASLLYLLLVVSFAVHCGFWQASFVSAAAIVCQAYFFAPPAFSFHISDPRNAVAILIFEVTALVVSRVSAREKRLATENQTQRVKLQRLFAISRGALLLDLNLSPERQMAQLILDTFELESVAIVNESLGAAGAAGRWAELAEDLDLIRILGLGGGYSPEHSETVLLAGTNRIGILAVQGQLPLLTLESLASLVVLTLERHGAFVKEGVAEAARQTEQLRSTVLDGLAHAFKTPLTIIRAASSGLLEVGNLDETQAELTGMIDEQSERLNDLTTRLLQTARVGSENLCLQRETVEMEDLLREVVSRFRREASAWEDELVPASPIRIQVPDQPLRISADHEMLRSTLTELLDNAVKYSHVGSSVTLAARSGPGEVLLSVHSWGQVINLEDRERIFERFYRSREHRHSAPGTGIGLSVARRATEAHHGHIWVTSSESEGTAFHISLPQDQPGA